VIIVDDGEWLRVITQPDHARFAGDLLSLWRTRGLPDHPRRGDLLFATREHDNGWQEADAAPWIDPETSRPFDFISYPEPDRREVWKRGIFRFAELRPLVALLIAEHAESIHQPLSVEWQGFFKDLEPHRHGWLEKAGVDRPTVGQDYRFLDLADTFSLALCTHTKKSLLRHGVEATVRGDLLALEPCPLVGTTSFQIPIRRIESRPYKSDTAIGSALARARWERWKVKVGPKSPVDA
jgi:hypothetical protein